MSKIPATTARISLLNWNLPKGEINPKALGYVCPNGFINFQTEKSALNYAKNRVIDSVRSTSHKPFERAVLIDHKTIIGEMDGDDYSVDIAKWGGKMANKTYVHSHPNKATLSLNDYLVMLEQDIKKMIAFDMDSHMYALEKLPEKTNALLNSVINKFMHSRNILIRGALATKAYATTESLNQTEPVLREKAEYLVHARIGAPYADNEILNKEDELKISMADIYAIHWNNVDAEKNGSWNSNMENMWRNIAEKIKCKYTSK